MLPLTLWSPPEFTRAVAARARALRLASDLSQAGLAARAGISLASLKRFEHTGAISFASLVRVAIALGATGELETWFRMPAVASIDEALKRAEPRRRGRRG